MMTKLSKINDSLPDLLLGELIYCIIAGVIIYIFFPNRVYNLIGLALVAGIVSRKVGNLLGGSVEL